MSQQPAAAKAAVPALAAGWRERPCHHSQSSRTCRPPLSAPWRPPGAPPSIPALPYCSPFPRSLPPPGALVPPRSPPSFPPFSSPAPSVPSRPAPRSRRHAPAEGAVDDGCSGRAAGLQLTAAMEPAGLLRFLRKLKEVFDVCDEDADGFIRVEHFVALGLQFGQGDEVSGDTCAAQGGSSLPDPPAAPSRCSGPLRPSAGQGRAGPPSMGSRFPPVPPSPPAPSGAVVPGHSSAFPARVSINRNSINSVNARSGTGSRHSGCRHGSVRNGSQCAIKGCNRFN